MKNFIWQLDRAQKENTLERRLKHFNFYSLLIIDELGHDILNETKSNYLFQLLQLRYEHHSTIISTNYNIGERSKIFPNCKIGMDAMLDRFLHHCNIVTINGLSYRTKRVSQYLLGE